MPSENQGHCFGGLFHSIDSNRARWFLLDASGSPVGKAVSSIAL